jgi:Putative prokaryotic signal transducing protein
VTGEQGNEPLVRIAQAGNQALAEMWKDVLRSNGIPSMVRIAGAVTAYVTFAAPHDILVLASDVGQARDLLAAYNEDERDLALGRPTTDDDETDNPYWMAGAEEDKPGG